MNHIILPHEMTDPDLRLDALVRVDANTEHFYVTMLQTETLLNGHEEVCCLCYHVFSFEGRIRLFAIALAAFRVRHPT